MPQPIDRSVNLSTAQMTLLQVVIAEGVRQSQQSAIQAHWSFLLALAMTTASALLSLGGASFLLAGKASEGSVTTAIGFASGLCSLELSKAAADRQKQANDRLDQLLRQIQGEEA